MMEYANTIKNLKKCSLSQESLARALGASFASVNCWGRGKTKPFKMAVKAIEEFCIIKYELINQMGGGVCIESR